MCAAISALEGKGVQVWKVRVFAEYIFKRDETRTVPFPHQKGECCVCGDDGGLKMQCGHFICPDDILNHAWDQIKNLKFEISCASCPAIIKTDDIIRFGLPDWEEKQFIETAISVNFCESQDIQQCPSCQSYCQRERTYLPQVHCTICTKKQNKDYEFCWYCLRKWNNPSDYLVCGNDKCRRVDVEKLLQSPKEQIRDRKGEVIWIPRIRVCPQCLTIIEHISESNEVTCSECKLEFCFICLAKTRSGSLLCRSRTYSSGGITCVVAPIQTKLIS